jgi:diguanylate cyclase (GGDEF)-like protein
LGRLIALVMIPVSVTGVIAASAVSTRRGNAHDAQAIADGVGKLDALSDLHLAISQLQTAAAFRVRFQELGVTLEVASQAVGIEVKTLDRSARAEASQALAVLGSMSPVSEGELRAAYVGVDQATLAPTTQAVVFARYAVLAQEAFDGHLDQVEASARRIESRALFAGLESLRATDRLTDVAARQGISLSTAWFAAPGATPRSRDAVLVKLGGDGSDYAAAEARLSELAVPSLVTGLRKMHEDPLVRAFDHAIAAASAGLRPDLASTNAVFRGYLVRSTILKRLVSSAAYAVRVAARSLRLSERNAFLAWAGLSLAFSLLLIGIAVAFARSIARPLRALGAYAHAVNEGRFDVEPGSGATRGPRETRAAFAAFGDLVASLRLLDAKATALATCAFDDPILDEPLPGRLGTSLESSVTLLSDSIVERERLQAHLAHQATHDSLTGIANRAAALVAIQTAIHHSTRYGDAVTLLFVDLNDFKAVNDRYGHDCGDEVLRQIAERMVACVRPGDFVARLGGDEFLVVAERVAGAAGATELARRLLEAVTEPIDVSGVSVEVGAAIGVAMALDSPEEPLRLLARADAAMYRAKRRDRSAIEIFDADMQQQMLEREEVEADLGRALADPSAGGLVLHYQPVLSAETGLIEGAEALVRWDRPGHGRLAPDAFIPIAEETSLIVDLDRWVLAEAGRCLVTWSADPQLAAVPIAVNISGRHLLSGLLVRHVLSMLEETGANPHMLTIEITETVLLDDLIAAGAELEALRALGVRVAIDDFGTGYTSLAHLQYLPIDVIKIDRSFTNQLDQHRGRSLVRMLTELGHANALAIVAEGVETAQELSALRSMGADQLQGYLLCPPLAPAAFVTWARYNLAAEKAAVGAVPTPRSPSCATSVVDLG